MRKSILDNTYLIKPITHTNHGEIKDLYDLCSDYYIIANGRNATDEDVRELFEYNDKKTLDNSLTLGIYNKCDLLIGVIDMLKNYPLEGTWMIGLLLISPNERNRNLGKIVHDNIKDYALSKGANTLRIGVLEQNIRARNFWDSLGYQLVKSTTIKLSNKESNVDILELPIMPIQETYS